jgi:hypothetical protein
MEGHSGLTRAAHGRGQIFANSSLGLGMNVFANIPALMQEKFVRVGKLFVPPGQITTTLKQAQKQV